MPRYRHWNELPSEVICVKTRKGWNLTLSVRKKTFKVVGEPDKFKAYSALSKQVGDWYHNCSNLLHDKNKKLTEKLESIRQFLNSSK
jgi:hypothetical protein